MTDEDNRHLPKKAPKKNNQPQSSHAGRLGDAEVEQHFSWQGPLPPPTFLRGFNDVVSDGAERVFRQFEAETEHRRQMERMTLECQIRDMLIGKVFALIFVLGVLAVAGYAISQGQAVLAGVLGTAVVCSVVWALVRVLGETDAQDRNQKPS
jgi:uncharacterized membrane protein